mgnify:CR=1 FL=1
MIRPFVEMSLLEVCATTAHASMEDHVRLDLVVQLTVVAQMGFQVLRAKHRFVTQILAPTAGHVPFREMGQQYTHAFLDIRAVIAPNRFVMAPHVKMEGLVLSP